MKVCRVRFSAVMMCTVVILCIMATSAMQNVYATESKIGTAEVPQSVPTAAEPAEGGNWGPDDERYYDSHGDQIFGLHIIGGKLYYFDEDNDGKKKTSGYMVYNTKLYHFASSGVATLHTGFYDKGKYYYCKGSKVSGFKSIDKKLYYFDAKTKIKKTSGYMTYNTKFYHFASNGVATLYTGFYNKGKYYYSKGSKVSGFKTINKKLYYFDTKTKIKKVSGYKNYKNRLYHFGSKGAAKVYSGVYSSYYYQKGIKQKIYKSTIRKMNNGKIYCFQKDGKVYKGSSWKQAKGKKYYFKKGVAVTGWKYVGKYKYYFSKNGILCKNLISRFGNQWKKRDLLIKVNRLKNCVTIYAKDGKKGYTIPVKAFVCSVGKAETRTPTGTFAVSRDRTYRWGLLGGPTMGGYCYGQYCSRITGSILFHSILYSKPNKWTMSSTAYNDLGKAASHGCIRLQTGNAKLIYDIARYKTTTVVIYDGESPGPFGKPTIKKVKWGQNYDPTDPNI